MSLLKSEKVDVLRRIVMYCVICGGELVNARPRGDVRYCLGGCGLACISDDAQSNVVVFFEPSDDLYKESDVHVG